MPSQKTSIRELEEKFIESLKLLDEKGEASQASGKLYWVAEKIVKILAELN